jgi:hypothetical protein
MGRVDNIGVILNIRFMRRGHHHEIYQNRVTGATLVHMLRAAGAFPREVILETVASGRRMM